MFNGKKGLESSIVVAIVIIITAAILLIAIKLITDTGNDMVDRESCRNSVLLKEKSKLIGKPLVGDISCETNLVEVNSKEEVEIKKIIANEMYDCWYQFGEGDHDFLSDYDFGKGDNYCFVCSRIEFSKETQQEIGQVTNLFDYLSNEPLPLHNQQTFFDYIYGDVSGEIKQQGYQDSYSTSEPVYIVFFGDKRHEWLKVDSTNVANLLTTIWASKKLANFGKLVGTGAKGGWIGVAVAVGGSIIYDATFIKTGYVSGLYVGQDSQLIQTCKQ